ncbi:MAG TPA: hypothetical protein VLA78_10930 [Paracoccaceae bacterium]|nr:hypothetical protein [Paracoccaceae bacterium]
MFRFFNPIEAMTLSIRMALAMAEAQRTMAVQMLAVAGALSGMARPAPDTPPAEPEAPVQMAAERARRAGGARRKAGGGSTV